MRIQSKFKDYYDYVEYLYSPEGGDPSNYYQRGLIGGASEGKVKIEVKGEIPHFPYPVSKYRDKQGYEGWVDFPWRFKWCAVCGKLYLLYCASSYPVFYKGWPSGEGEGLEDWKLITKDDPILKRTTKYTGDQNPKMEDVVAIPSEVCREVSRILKAPVFIIDRVKVMKMSKRAGGHPLLDMEVAGHVPSLGKLGFPALVPAEQMYQEISMFLGSLKGNPDDLPPVKVSDRDRLVQKGFDEKKSFRGKPLN